MTNGFDEMILNMTDTTPEPEDYTGEDGLLYCGKCHKPKEGYFPKETAAWLGRDRHPAECDCQRAEREEREAAEKQRSHLETVERLKRRGFTDPAMQGWTFENDNGKCPQMEHAHFYVENWETMKERNIGYLLWGGVGTGKSYFAGCIANALTVILYFGIHFVWSHGKRHYSKDENISPSMIRTSSIGIFEPSCIVIRRSKSSTFLTVPTADTYLPPAFRSSGWK